eukprot:359349-Chlamydomonas_euryale.AAC.2
MAERCGGRKKEGTAKGRTVGGKSWSTGGRVGEWRQGGKSGRRDGWRRPESVRADARGGCQGEGKGGKVGWGKGCEGRRVSAGLGKRARGWQCAMGSKAWKQGWKGRSGAGRASLVCTPGPHPSLQFRVEPPDASQGRGPPLRKAAAAAANEEASRPPRHPRPPRGAVIAGPQPWALRLKNQGQRLDASQGRGSPPRKPATAASAERASRPPRHSELGRSRGGRGDVQGSPPRCQPRPRADGRGGRRHCQGPASRLPWHSAPQWSS